MNIIKNSTSNKNKFLLVTVILISVLPALTLIGSLVSNSALILISLAFLIHIFLNKQYKIFNSKFFLVLLFFFVGLIFNYIFSEIPKNSFSRVFGFFRFFILSLSIFYIFNYKDNIFKKFILNSWVILFLFVTIDLLIEFITGKNILGYTSNYIGRLGSFTGDELKIGNYFLAFSFIALSTLYNKFKNLKFLVFSLFLILFFGFIIGERANFIRLVGISFLFLFFLFLFKKKIKAFFILTLSFILLIFSIITYDRINNHGKKVDTYNERYYIRYLKEFNKILDSSLLEYIKNDTRHGLHYYTAINIFKDYKLTGVGLKNFRIFSNEDKYNPEFSNQSGFATHPHQVHFEILSEMGILGFIFFFITFFIILKESYQRNYAEKNLLGLSAASFLLVTFLPLIPSGSFFTSYSATLFWMNFGLIYNLRYKLE